jgi:arsenate reductase (thioredoxin)
MAAALFNASADPSLARAISAGTRPGPRVHPVVLEAMREVGIDLGGTTPRRLTPELAKGATLLITMGCGEECPYIPGVQREDWPLEDPAGLPVEKVRPIREEVRRRVGELVRRRGW